MSIGTAVRALYRAANKSFPGASKDDIKVYVDNHLALVSAEPGVADKDIAEKNQTKLIEAANNGDEWAINLRDAVLLNTIKPIVEKAADRGVDPVAALVLNADLTEEQAREYVEVLEERATAPSIPSQSTDSGSSINEDEDEDEDEGTFAPAVTVSH